LHDDAASFIHRDVYATLVPRLQAAYASIAVATRVRRHVGGPADRRSGV
jgi:hypothetical protein